MKIDKKSINFDGYRQCALTAPTYALRARTGEALELHRLLAQGVLARTKVHGVDLREPRKAAQRAPRERQIRFKPLRFAKRNRVQLPSNTTLRNIAEICATSKTVRD